MHQLALDAYGGNNDSSIIYIKQAIPYFKKSGDQENYIKELLIYSTLLRRSGQYEIYYETAKFNLNEIEDLVGTEHSHYGAALNNLGSYYYDRGDFQESINYSKKSIRIFQTVDKLSLIHI